MNLVPQTRRSTWTCNGVELVSTIVCVGRSLSASVGRRISYRPLYTVEVEFGTRVARVRNVSNAVALACELEVVRWAFTELGVLTP
jgi:hypothetical protein